MLPTATRSPTANRVTSGPTPVTSPTNSWPGTSGGASAASPSTACRSLWHTPTWVTRTATSSLRRSRRCRVSGRSGPPGPYAA
jgi:hypothetical protein